MGSAETPNPTPPAATPPAANREMEGKQDSIRHAQHPQQDVEGLGVNIRTDFRSFLELDEQTLPNSSTLRWVRKDRLGITRAKMKKYQFVDPDSKLGAKLRNAAGEPPEIDAEGHFSVGDLVLMHTPKRNHRIRQRAKQKEGERRLGVMKRKFKKAARQAGVEVFEKDD